MGHRRPLYASLTVALIRGTVLASLSLMAVALGHAPAMAADPTATAATVQALADVRLTRHDPEAPSNTGRQAADRGSDRITVRMSPLQLGALTPEAFGDLSGPRN